MKKASLLRALLIALICLILPMTISAQGAAISSPSMNATVRGQVLIQGTASHPNFWKYEVYVGPEPNTGNQWIMVGTIHETQVANGLLETWNTASVPDGTYSIRLRVVDKTGNYQEYHVRQIKVANAAPTETATVTATRPPTNTPMPRNTPTVLVIEPTTDIAPATATPTLARPTSQPLVSIPGIDLQGWGEALLMGAGAMLAIFVLVGLIQLVRRIL